MKLSKEDQIRLAAIRDLIKHNDKLQEERYRLNNWTSHDMQSTVEKLRDVEEQIAMNQPSWELIKFLVDVIDELVK